MMKGAASSHRQSGMLATDSSAERVGVLLMALGGPDSLESVGPYLQDLRGGRPTPPALIDEITERYRVTGGKSPVLAITRELAGKSRGAFGRAGRRRMSTLGSGTGIPRSARSIARSSKTASGGSSVSAWRLRTRR